MMTINDVVSATGLSRGALYRLRRSGAFPEPAAMVGRSPRFEPGAVRRWREGAKLDRDWAALLQAGEGSVFAPLEIAPLKGTPLDSLVKSAAAHVPSPPSPQAAKAAEALAKSIVTGAKKGFGLKKLDAEMEAMTSALAARCAAELAALLPNEATATSAAA